MEVVKLEVEDEKWPDFKRHFLRIHPNQTIDSAGPLSDDDWIRYRIFLFARGVYEKGYTAEYYELNGPIFDTNMINSQT